MKGKKPIFSEHNFDTESLYFFVREISQQLRIFMQWMD
jgi:hypothetical protein